MCVGKSFHENKRELKKSIAKMMVYWVVHTRHDLRQELIDKDPTRTWAGLALQEAFDDKEEWEEFFRKAATSLMRRWTREAPEKSRLSGQALKGSTSE